MKDLSRRRGLSFGDVILYTSATALALFPAGMTAVLIWQACKSGY